ncbi:MAG: D-alanyl-D-alanine carboxypeptidase [Flavobacterium sp. BFFFF1]|uniref:serine hydrolase domain-containing protein n=1 Tax=Flavobacterium sp. BFFFF1 TaxID=2015557 RepID=UPI000BD3515D|nr:serine hydrolase domain-containing protein [Flavobacterium sp. BFFFF1]OYU82271.1 MAG: D-alanyl-D-alanine carboxypeptidase [Flavobacterium sp. BFFFF1]
MRKITLLFLICLSVKMNAQQTDKYKKLDSLLHYLSENNKFMGSVTLREKDKIVFSHAYGFSDFDHNVKAFPKTKYKIGSITKMFTASIIFQLIEANILKLDTKISKYFPEIKNAEKITIADLLGHRSGIFNFTNDPDFAIFSEIPQTRESMVKRIAAYEPVFEPNSKSDYSNSNYLLLGYIIETITKKSYPENVTERIVKKIGLSDTKYYGKIDASNNEAFSYAYDGKTWEKREEWQESVAYAAGALQSTTDDLTVFVRALFEGKLINKTSLSAMTTITDGYGKGIFTFPFFAKTFYGHTGGIEGFSSMLGYNQEDGLAYAMTVNGANYDTNQIAIYVLSSYYGTAFKWPEFKTVAVDEKKLQSYAGIYATDKMPIKITIAYNNGGLTAQATGQSAFPLTAESETDFTFEPAGITISFSENAFKIIQGGMTTDFKKDQE